MSGPHEYSMCGVKVKFPAKAYPSQVAMMSKIVTSLKRSQNSLLESPTGSGKSLALLCAALAWQEAEQKKCDDFNHLLEIATNNQDPAMRDLLVGMAGDDGVEWEDEMEAPAQNNHNQYNVTQNEVAAMALATAESLGGGGFIPVDPDDADFADPGAQKPFRPEASSGYHLTPGGLRAVGPGAGYLRMPKKKKCPRIYFGTRTHKQVAQIVRELKKTAYAGVRMTILASREHTCIHPTVSKSFNKNQDCQDLMDKKKGGGCRFQANVKQKMSSHHSVRAYIGSDQAWDLEELVKAGKKVKCCPYYATRELKNSAQIILCPYNYLVEPGIRKSMEISLKNQIVILDEAHNIEDSAREAASGKYKLDEVTAAMQDCESMVEHDILPGAHGGLAAFLSRLGMWMQKAAEEASDYTDFNSSTKVWTGTNGMAEWNEILFQPESWWDIKNMVQEALKEQSASVDQNEDGFDAGHQKVLSKLTSNLLEGIFSMLDFMHRKDSLYRDDYRMSVVKAQERKKGGKARGWTGRGDAPALVSTVTLNFWCLNPGVCFDEMLDCKSIVLTSGTLSPMVTFASELEVKFPITLEANHVIDKSQVWVGTIGSGPTGHSLNAAYQNANTFGFQDEVGRLVLDICKTIPHGVLVFFPSYKMLNDLSERWRSNGTWQQLFERKAIVTEPRFGDQLDVAMKEFYSVIEASNNQPNEYGQDGALFMAVCRGKVSEGLDFADNNARAVVCVGIPFPAFKDTLVDLKKKYNDGMRAKKPNTLPGRDWYEIQAFRALNQALGRCIRHKKDWGAILMVDGRYGQNPRYVNSLSKWVRGKVVNYNNTNNMLSSLKTFSSDMKLFDAENASVLDAFAAPPTDTPAPPGPEPSSASTPNQAASKTLASKVSSLVNLRKSSPGLTSDFQVWSKKGRKSEKQDDTADKGLHQPQLPHLDTGDNLNTATHLNSGLDNKSHLSYDLDSKSHLMCSGTESTNTVSVDDGVGNFADQTEILLDGEKVRLGPPKSRGRQKKLKAQIKLKNSKVDWNDPEAPAEAFLPNMNFNNPAGEESFETLYNDSTINSTSNQHVHPVVSPPFEESFETLYNNSTTTSSSTLSLKVSSNKNLKIVPNQSHKSMKMSFVSTDEEEDSKPVVRKVTNYETYSVPVAESKKTVQSSKVSDIGSGSNTAISAPTSASLMCTSESVKRKKCSMSSPECHFDLTEEFDLLEEDNTDIKDKKSTNTTSNFVRKLQQFRFEGNDEASMSNVNTAGVLETTVPEEVVDHHQDFVSCSSLLGGVSTEQPASKRSRLSSGKRARKAANTSEQFLRYSSVSELEKENSEDRALVQMMLKRRRESGQGESVDPQFVLETPEAAGVVLETPDEMDNLDLGSDFEDDKEYEPSKSTALVDVSNQPQGSRKPLFSSEPCNPHTASPSIIYSSGDEVWPEENKPQLTSLSSADEIEEPEDFCRRVKQPVSKKVKKKRKSEGGNRSNLSLCGKNGRLSLTLGTSMCGTGNNSDDDFM